MCKDRGKPDSRNRANPVAFKENVSYTLCFIRLMKNPYCVFGRGKRIVKGRKWAPRTGIGNLMVGGRAFIVGVLTFLASICLTTRGGERSGGAIRFSAESINSGGVSFRAGANISLGGTVGQPCSTKIANAGDTSLSLGFWHPVSNETKPRGTLFLLR